jgi:hypothetical protein
MKFLRSSAFTVLAFCSCLLLISLPHRSLAGEMDQAVLQADHAFVQDLANGDNAKLTSLLDENFTWCDSNGKTLSGAEVLRALPKDLLGDESGVDITERTYGQGAAVSASRGKVHVLRLWVQRPSGWRLLVYHEVSQLDQPSTSAIIASWQALETAVTAHESAGWAPHIADEFVQISSSSDHPITKSGRMATLDKQKQLGVGSAPSPLVSAKMFDFGDSVVMTCVHQPYTGKPVQVSRLWIKRDGQWVMVISYQTAIQAGAAKAD